LASSIGLIELAAAVENVSVSLRLQFSIVRSPVRILVVEAG
jgi:hypothetical protein